jgi:polysaccharide deacetylase family protein (PEP-CTERM system associated)
MPAALSAMSIDLEDWYHGELIHRHVGPNDRTARVRVSLEPILEMLSRRRIVCTFFVLGEVARQHPDLVRELHSAGHEIACHGMTHIPLWRLTETEFRGELREFKEVIKGIDPSISVVGFRAPTFSLDSRTSWALRVLDEEGFAYDSSIFPFANHVYGVPGAPLTPYKPDFGDITKSWDAGRLWEFPLAVWNVLGFKIPVSGGFYMRALPSWFTALALRRINRERPFVLYCHPWECDPGIPRRPLGLVNSLITYTGIDEALSKLGRLLDEFSCTRIDAVLQNYEGALSKLGRLLDEFPSTRIDAVLRDYGRHQALLRTKGAGL